MEIGQVWPQCTFLCQHLENNSSNWDAPCLASSNNRNEVPTALLLQQSVHYLILLPLLRLDLGNLLGGERLEVCRVLCVGLPAGWAQAVALSAELVPTEAADLKWNSHFYTSMRLANVHILLLSRNLLF